MSEQLRRRRWSISALPGASSTWAIPDRWNDVNGNGTLEAGEPYNPVTTGYQAPRDVGMTVVLKQGDPHDTIAPGVFYPVCFPPLGRRRPSDHWRVRVSGLDQHLRALSDRRR
jgi:hypothetical protein